MSRWFKKSKEKERKVDIKTPYNKPSGVEHVISPLDRRQSSSSLDGRDDNGRPTSSPSSNELLPPSSQRPGSVSPVPSPSMLLEREPSRSSVKAKAELYESLSKSTTPEHVTYSPSRSSGRLARSGSSSQGTTPTHDSSLVRNRMSGLSQTTPTKSTTDYSFLHDVSSDHSTVAKEFKGVTLPLPPLRTSRVKHRDVIAVKSPVFGGFGFNLRKSFQPDPNNSDNTLLVHLVEPRPSYIGPLMSGDRILEVNGENVETSPHERVVELIRLSGDRVNFRVASVPELIELNERGVFEEVRTYSSAMSKKGVKAGAGTLRKKAAQRGRQPVNFQVCLHVCIRLVCIVYN